MKRALRGLIVAAALLAPSAMARPAPDGFSELAERLLPAVVNISTSQKVERPDIQNQPQVPPGYEDMFKDYYENDNASQMTSLGSGFVIDPSGIIVTNNHVIEGADEITVNFPDGLSLKAEIVGKDEKTDLAALRVKSDKPLASVPFGDSNVLKVGDWVMAIGNPFGLGGTVTAGIVSARNRDIEAGAYDAFIQTDAAINHGNSGGPLFDMDGAVVGVNSAIISPTGGSVGLGFAIPASTVKRTVEQLVKFGETRRGWIGVRTQKMTDELAAGLGLDRAHGALIAEVTTGGPADAAGLKAQDVILSFNGQDVKDSRALPRLVAETDIGAQVPVNIWRDKAAQTITVTLGRLEDYEKSSEGQAAPAPPVAPEAPPVEAGSVRIDTLGITVAELNDALRERFTIAADVTGVVITAIAPGSAGATAEADGRIRVGDVIVQVAQQEVSAAQDAADKVNAAASSGMKVVMLLINRSGQLTYAAIRLAE